MISVRRSSPYCSLDLVELLEHHVEDLLVAREQRLQLRDLRAQLGELVEHLLALERGERAQAHVEDRLRLALGEREARSCSAVRAAAVSSAPRMIAITLVEVVERDREALEDVGARLGLGEVVGGAPRHHLAAEVEEVLERLLQRERLRAGRSTSASMFTPNVVCSGVCL